jgi:hypothetical protein
MIIFGFLLEKNIISPVCIPFEFVLVGYLVLTVFLTFLIIRKTYFIDEILLKKDCIRIPKIGEIKFLEIQKIKTFSYRGYKTFYIKLKNGDKIAIGPFNNFSTEACRIFEEFMEEFKNCFQEVSKKSFNNLHSN